MRPIFFGASERRLFGIYEPPVRVRSDALGIVLCYPWGPEYLHAHRAMRRLSAMLSAAGHHILRFDYHGTGDSGGDMVTETLNDWESDVQTAAAELREIAPDGGIALVGLRLGAVLAARAAALMHGSVNALVLWDPVIDGPAYRTELFEQCKVAHLMSGGAIARSGKPGGGHEVLGYPLSDALDKSLAELEWQGLAPLLPERTLLVGSGSQQALASARQTLAREDPVSVAYVPGLPCWKEEWPVNVGVIPGELLRRIEEWIG